MKDNMTLKEAIQLKIGDLVQFEDTIEVVTGEYQYSKKSGGWSVRLETLGISCHNFRYFKKLA